MIFHVKFPPPRWWRWSTTITFFRPRYEDCVWRGQLPRVGRLRGDNIYQWHYVEAENHRQAPVISLYIRKSASHLSGHGHASTLLLASNGWPAATTCENHGEATLFQAIASVPQAMRFIIIRRRCIGCYYRQRHRRFIISRGEWHAHWRADAYLKKSHMAIQKRQYRRIEPTAIILRNHTMKRILARRYVHWLWEMKYATTSLSTCKMKNYQIVTLLWWLKYCHFI